MNVAVLGASDNPERYSYKAVQLLKENGHQVFPVNPKLQSLEGLKVYPGLENISEKLQTISVYLSKENSSKMTEEILRVSPDRIIFNPGAENPELAARARQAGIRTLEACTLVLLRTKQFEK